MKLRIIVCVTILLSVVTMKAQDPPISFPGGSGLSSFDGTDYSSWDGPVGLLFSKDGTQLFVWEKSGKVYVCNRNPSGEYIRQSTPVIDISDEVGNWRDFGLLGFALDPQFQSNKRIYLYYVVDRHYLLNKDDGQGVYDPNTNWEYNATIGRLTRYNLVTSGGNLVTDYDSRYVLLGETKKTGVPILYESHAGGGLVFAEDGTLLVATGEGASYSETDDGSKAGTYYQAALQDSMMRPEENVGAFRSQILNSYSGKLLRIDRETGYGIVSNPFYDAGNPQSAKSKVWALGLRNPFRISIKPGSGSTNPSVGDIGEVFIGDVGYSDWEELSVVKEPGQNLGWPLYEGYNIQEDYILSDSFNRDMPNPLYNGTSCTQQFLKFKDLIREDNVVKDGTIYSPCDNNVSIYSGSQFLHARPSLAWRHFRTQEMPDTAFVGRFDENGNAIKLLLGSPESGTTGTNFRGNCTSGGIWYTGAGNSFPEEYKNTFIFSDFADKWIKRVTLSTSEQVSRVDNIAFWAGPVLCLAENPIDGSIFYTNYSEIKKITFGGNMLPVAVIKADAYYSQTNSLTVNFSAADSYDPTPGGSVVAYSWNFGDPVSGSANTSNSVAASHTFTTSETIPVRYVVKCTVTDNETAVSKVDSIIIFLNNTPPLVTITNPVKNSTYTITPEPIIYQLAANVGYSTDPPPFPVDNLTYQWQTTLFHNDHKHPEPIDIRANAETRVVRLGCNTDEYHWLVTLKVTDPVGLSTTDSSQVYPDCLGALPLFLHKFSVTKQGASNIVNWRTLLESGLEHFEVERSSDGVTFWSIHLQSARNTEGANEYSFVDNTAPGGINYYRLKMVERDNVIRYSIVIKVSTELAKRSLFVSPNPVVNNFSLSYQTESSGTATIQIKDMAGKVLKTFTEGVTKGNNVIYVQNMADWRSGVYIISLQQGNNVEYTKFIKAEK